MGNWILEVCRVAMYISFPVALFHIFNQPAYFEEWVTKKKRELYPPENLSHREELQKAIRDIREKHDEKLLRELQELENKEKA